MYKSAQRLAKHQIEKRHFGCSVCDALFPTLLTLEQHKESLQHYDDDDQRETDESDESEDDDLYQHPYRLDEPERLL